MVFGLLQSFMSLSGRSHSPVSHAAVLLHWKPFSSLLLQRESLALILLYKLISNSIFAAQLINTVMFKCLPTIWSEMTC